MVRRKSIKGISPNRIKNSCDGELKALLDLSIARAMGVIRMFGFRLFLNPDALNTFVDFIRCLNEVIHRERCAGCYLKVDKEKLDQKYLKIYNNHGFCQKCNDEDDKSVTFSYLMTNPTVH